MPTISFFYGIIVRMFFDEHGVPHFHAQYGEYKATIDIENLVLLEGELPRRAIEIVLDWAELRKDQLLQNWERCRKHEMPQPIEPLK